MREGIKKPSAVTDKTLLPFLSDHICKRVHRYRGHYNP